MVLLVFKNINILQIQGFLILLLVVSVCLFISFVYLLSVFAILILFIYQFHLLLGPVLFLLPSNRRERVKYLNN